MQVVGDRDASSTTCSHDWRSEQPTDAQRDSEKREGPGREVFFKYSSGKKKCNRNSKRATEDKSEKKRTTGRVVG